MRELYHDVLEYKDHRFFQIYSQNKKTVHEVGERIYFIGDMSVSQLWAILLLQMVRLLFCIFLTLFQIKFFRQNMHSHNSYSVLKYIIIK